MSIKKQYTTENYIGDCFDITVEKEGLVITSVIVQKGDSILSIEPGQAYRLVEELREAMSRTDADFLLNIANVKGENEKGGDPQ